MDNKAFDYLKLGVNYSDYYRELNNNITISRTPWGQYTYDGNITAANLSLEKQAGKVNVRTHFAYSYAVLNTTDTTSRKYAWDGTYEIRQDGRRGEFSPGFPVLQKRNNNNFINNMIQASDDDPGFTNRWNESYPTGGNYWSDYDEPPEGAHDGYSGPSQDVGPGSDDGIAYMKSWHFGWSRCYYFNKHDLWSPKRNPERFYREYFLRSYISLNRIKRMRYRGQAAGVRAYIRGEKAFRLDGSPQAAPQSAAVTSSSKQ